MSRSFELDSKVSLLDLAQTHLTPSRSIGPPDPDAPEFTWLRGASPAPAPPAQRPAGAAVLLPQPATESPGGGAGQDAPQPLDIIGAITATGAGIIFLDEAAVAFGGELLQLSSAEMASIMEVVLDAYDRVLRERSDQLRVKYLLAAKGAQPPMHPPGSTGQPVVPPVQGKQEEAHVEAT